MAVISAQLAGFSNAGGVITLQWADNISQRFDSVAAFRQMGINLAQAQELAKQCFIATYLFRDPTLSNPAAALNKTLTIDPSSNNLMVVTLT